MEGGEGMVAVVRGLRDAGLAVTLLEGNTQYTLMPNTVLNQSAEKRLHVTYSNKSSQHGSSEVCADAAMRCDSSAQATDGRYASIYKMAHCNVTPTSPPVQVTEFPPQRAEICRGHGNFEVGGSGSGETTYSPTRVNSSYRGGMSWSDRGSVCTPRPSPEPDAFANCLRKYPSMSPERSAEIFERLISYSQTKDTSKNRIHISPTRTLESNPSSQNLDRNFSRNTMSRYPPRLYETEVNLRPRSRNEEPPTRDVNPKKANDCEYFDKRRVVNKNCEVRCLKDASRRVRDNIKNMACSYSQPVCSNIRGRYHHLPPEQRILPDQNSTNSVNIEIQGNLIHSTAAIDNGTVDDDNDAPINFAAAVPMVSREVSTLPRVEPSRRSVAVPLSRSSSNADRSQEGESNRPDNQKETSPSFKYVQTTFSLVDLTKNLRNIYTTSSSTKIPNLVNFNEYSLKSGRKSKSQEELTRNNNSIPKEILKFLEDITMYSNVSIQDRNEDLYKCCECDEKIKIKFCRCIKNIPISHPEEAYHPNIEEHQIDKVYTKFKRQKIVKSSSNSTYIYQAEVDPFRVTNEDFDVKIKKWFNGVPTIAYDFSGRKVDREQVVNAVTNQLKALFLRSKEENILKHDIINILEEAPIDVFSCYDKRNYLSRQADALLKKINNSFTKKNTCNPTLKKYSNNMPYICKKYIQPTEEDLREFVRDELAQFLEKSQMNIYLRRLEDIEIELLDVIIDSMEAIRTGNVIQVKEEVVTLLCEIGQLSKHQAIRFTNVIFEHLTNIINTVDEKSYKPQTEALIVLQNTTQKTFQENQTTSNNANDTSEFSIKGITETDINANVNLYRNKLSEQIDEWLTNILGPPGDDKAFREVVVSDLAGDIIDRHKYLELNLLSRGTNANELEHLKYQIFKWINKLVGEDNAAHIDYVSQLMQRIRNIPVPLLTIPQPNINTSLPPSQMQPNINLPEHSVNSTEAQNTSAFFDKHCSSPLKFAAVMEGTNLNSRQRSVFGPSSPGGSMMESVERKTISDRRQSSPNAFSNVPNAKNVDEQANIDQKPMYGAGGSITEAFNRRATSERRFSSPDDMAFTPMQMPMLGPKGDLSVPLHSTPLNRKFNAPVKFCSQVIRNENQMPTFESTEPCMAELSRASPEKNSTPGKIDYATTSYGICTRGTNKLPPTRPSIKQLNEEYDEYVNNWVKQVPIATSNPDEEALAEKARLAIYNGIWKAITKLKLNAATFHNPFYYQDLLDDEIEELLSYLPQTPEMLRKKQLLKAQLIERTTRTTEEILTSAAPASLRQQLVENVSNTLPRSAAVDSIKKTPPAQLYEELQKLNLAEDFILYTSFREDDKPKANVYRRKLLKRVEELVDVVQKNHGKDLKNIDAGIYIDEVMSALHKVPLPSEETIREEADEIVLGIEIEQWFSDLPLVPNDDYLEQLNRRRHRNALAKKIHEMEKVMNFADISSERELKHEITKFLERLPLRDEQNLNKNFMVDELVNRLKNRPRNLNTGTRRKSVAFDTPFNYEHFSEEMQLCSSYAELPPDQQSSHIIVGGTRVKDMSHYYRMKPPDTEDSNQQWITIEDSRSHPVSHIGGYEPVDDPAISCRPYTSAVRGPALQVPQQDQQWLTIEESRAPPYKICSHKNNLPDEQAMNGRSVTTPFKQFLEASLGHQPRMSYSGNRQCSGGQPTSVQSIQDPSYNHANCGACINQVNGRACSPRRISQVSTFSPNLGYQDPCSPNSAPTELGRPGLVQSPSPGNMSIYDQLPLGYSTPQQVITQGTAPRPGRKRTRETERERRDAARRRLELEDLDEEDAEMERDEERCRCMERFWRCQKKRPIFYTYDDFDMDFPPCFPMRHPCRYFF